LTRRLVDVSQDVIINAKDCGTEDGITIRKSDDIAGQSLGNRVYGRNMAERVIHPKTGEVILEKGELADREQVRQVTKAAVEQVKVFSPMTCELEHGVCAKCYGLDLGRGREVDVGASVGTVAAQSIGEPGTQLTLRTFHSGGVAAVTDITTGLPRVEELFEARKSPKGEAVISEIAGAVKVEQSERYEDLRIVHVIHREMVSDAYEIASGWKILVEEEDEIEQGDVIAEHKKKDDQTIVAEHEGRVRIDGDQVIVSREIGDEKEYEIPNNARLTVSDGDKVEPGDPLTEGSLNTHDLLRIRGRKATQMYLLSEVQNVYRSQGQNIHDKHFEIIIRKMMSRVDVTKSGDSEYLPGDLVNRLELLKANEKLLSEGKRPAQYRDVLLGITKAALNTESFLSAASFQHTIKVLTRAAAAGAKDPLYGLKENVIIGKLIPAGTGFVNGPFAARTGKVETYEDLPVASFSDVPADVEAEEEVVVEAEDEEEAAVEAEEAEIEAEEAPAD